MTDAALDPDAQPGARGRVRTLWVGRAIAAMAGILLVLYPMLSDDIYYQNMIILSLVFAVGASGLNVISGFAGYMSLGQGAFIGLGGYTIGVLAGRFEAVNPWWWVPAAGQIFGISLC